MERRLAEVFKMGLVPRRYSSNFQSLFVILVLLLDQANCSISSKETPNTIKSEANLKSEISVPWESGLKMVELLPEGIREIGGGAVHGSSICEVCEKISGQSVPFYCSIKPELEQCQKIMCPKSCEEGGENPQNITLPPMKPPPPPPVSLPKIPASLLPPLPFSSPNVGKSVSDIVSELAEAIFPDGRSLDGQLQIEPPEEDIPKILDKLSLPDLRNLLDVLPKRELSKILRTMSDVNIPRDEKRLPIDSKIPDYLDSLRRPEMLKVFYAMPMEDLQKLMSHLILSEIPHVINALPQAEIQKLLIIIPLFELRRILEGLELSDIRKVINRIPPIEIQKVLSMLSLPEIPPNVGSLPVSEIPKILNKLHLMDIREVLEAIPLSEIHKVIRELNITDIRKFLHVLPVHHMQKILQGLQPADNSEGQPASGSQQVLSAAKQKLFLKWKQMGIFGGNKTAPIMTLPGPGSLAPQPQQESQSNLLRSARTPSPLDLTTPYNDETCELNSPNLVRLKAGSKYIEYRPDNHQLQIKDVHEAAQAFGLVLAEFHYPTEWHSVEKSPVLKTVSDYKLTEKEPRIFYAIGADDDDPNEFGDFLYPNDNTSLTFHILNPAIYGRTDERCAVITSVLGSDKKQYLTTRLRDCDKNFEDPKKVVYGLFMYPPGSMCYRRSVEECTMLKNHQSGKKFHHLIEMGQTRKRFIYFFTDQRNWFDAQALCKAKGLTFLDLDPAWDDALTIVEIIERFLKSTRLLAPSTMFWTAGRYESGWSDGKFKWETTKTFIWNYYQKEPAPYPFSFWDGQPGTNKKIDANPESDMGRRTSMKQPCIALALNPETGDERPKLNFKVWYCNFPMFPLCYKKIEGTSQLDAPLPSQTIGNRPIPADDACGKPPPPPPPTTTTTTTPKPVENMPTPITTTTPKPPAYFMPFNPSTCKSESLLVRVLTPDSKYVAYEPTNTSFSIDQIKSHCIKFGLIPAEIRNPDDWESIRKSGIDGYIQGDPGDTTDQFYAFGMDDSVEAGKIRYNSDDGELLFSMFHPEGEASLGNQCAILDSVIGPDGSKGFMMLHDNCDEGLMSAEKVAYGLCMFPRDSKCFKKSKEEKAATDNKASLTTIIDLGVTKTRSIFFSPHQRDWEGAKEFCEHAKLQLLDFDPKWADTKEIVKIFTSRIARVLDQFQLTPIWTSGRLEGKYADMKGTWMTGGKKLDFPTGGVGLDFQWRRLNDPELDQIREGSMDNPCVEVSFDDVNYKAMLRPDYCYMPKYFFCYRKNKRRVDPSPKNTFGLSIIELE